jgi:hypothetical protein
MSVVIMQQRVVAVVVLLLMFNISSAWTTVKKRTRTVNGIRKESRVGLHTSISISSRTNDRRKRCVAELVLCAQQSTQDQYQCAEQSSRSTGTVASAASASAFLNFGILVSSFTDGMASPSTQQFVQYSLASLLTMDTVLQTQHDIEHSAKHSPCQGPDIDLLNQLERGDHLLLQRRRTGSTGTEEPQNVDMDRAETTRSMMEYLEHANANANANARNGGETEIKVLYIPTAMYALRADSNNSPGKQRQRARADGKKRRNQLVTYIQDILTGAEDEDEVEDENEEEGSSSSPASSSAASSSFPKINVNILATTLDLDDGSIKQSQSQSSGGSDAEADASKFPKDGKEALTSWNPHVIYLEGGNTFWLHHCMNKKGEGGEDWMQLIRDSCCIDINSPFPSRRPALYIGKSAGSIVAGKYVETATWKGWDDPSVVPGKETYQDWIHKDDADASSEQSSNSLGLNLVGGASVFPHMSDDWLDLVQDKKESLPKEDGTLLYCLQEWDACCVEGSAKDVFLS